VLDKHVPLFKRAFVQQDINALARGESAFFVLRVDTSLATPQAGELALIVQLLKDVMHGCVFLGSNEKVES